MNNVVHLALRKLYLIFRENGFNKFFHLIFKLTIAILFLGIPSVTNTDFNQSTLVPKSFFFIYILLLATLFFFLFLLSKRSINIIRISKIDICIFLFVIYVLANRYLVQEDFGFSIRFIEFLGLLILYIMFRNLSLKFYYWLLLIVAISGIAQAIYGSMQIIGYFPSFNSRFNTTGSFFNPGPYGGFLAMVWPIALGLNLYKNEYIIHFKAKYKRNKKTILKVIKGLFTYIPIISLITIFIVLPSTRSRSAWLAVILSSALLYAFNFFYKNEKIKQIRNSKNKIRIILLLIVVSSLTLYGLYFFKKESANGRMLIWRISTNIIKENPLLGVGFDRFKTYYMNYQGNYFIDNRGAKSEILADNISYPFNEILQLLVENGFVGILPIIFIVVYALKSIGRHSSLSKIFFSVSLSLMIFGMFSYPSQILPIKMIGVMAISFFSRNDTTWIHMRISYSSIMKRKLIFNLVVLIFIIISFNWAYRKTIYIERRFKEWKVALDYYNYELYEKSVSTFESIVPFEFYNEGTFLMNYGKALLMSGNDEKAIKILKKCKHYLNNTVIEIALGDAYKRTKQYSKAESAYTNALNMTPNRFYPIYLLAKLYSDTNQPKRACQMAKLFLTKPIKMPSSAIEQMTKEMESIINR